MKAWLQRVPASLSSFRPCGAAKRSNSNTDWASASDTRLHPGPPPLAAAEAVKHTLPAASSHTSLLHRAQPPLALLSYIAYLTAVLRVNQDKSLLGKRSYPGTLHRTHTGIFFQHMPKPRGYPARNDGGILTYAGFSGAKPVSQCSLCERCCS